MQTDSRDRLTVPGDQEECVDSGMNWDIGAAALGSQKKLRPKGEGCSERGTAPPSRTSSASAEAPQSLWAALNSLGIQVILGDLQNRVGPTSEGKQIKNVTTGDSGWVSSEGLI